MTLMREGTFWQSLLLACMASSFVAITGAQHRWVSMVVFAVIAAATWAAHFAVVFWIGADCGERRVIAYMERESPDATRHLRDRIAVAIFDEAATWEQQFDGGPGHVVGVPDAATVAARAAHRWLLWRGIDIERFTP